MAVIRNLVVKISADISSLSKGLNQASKNLQKVSQTFTSIGGKLTAGITLPITALGSAAVKTSAEFEQSMANAASVAGASSEELERMTKLAREMGSKTVFSASQAADALYYMASAGYKVDQMADSIEATLNLASATQSDLAFTTDTVVSALNIFGLEASEAQRVTNLYASAIGNSMANMDKLATSMGYIGPVANSLGYSIEEVVGALSVLYDMGYDGSTAGTGLRQGLVSLMNPTAEAQAVFEELGLTYEELNPATNDLASIITKLGEAGMDTSQAMKVFGARAGPAMLALLSKGGDAVADMTKKITGTTAATDMAGIQLDTLTGQWKILKSELEEIAISFGDVLIPMIREFISKYISPLTKKLMGLTNEQRKMAVQIALVVAAIGPLFLGLGKVIHVVLVLVKIIPLLFSKVGLIIGAITLIGAKLVSLYKTNEDFRNKVIELWNKIKETILKTLNALKSWWKQNGEQIKESSLKAIEIITTVFIERFKMILNAVRTIWPQIKQIITMAISNIKTFWDKYGESFKNAVISAFKLIDKVVVSVITTMLPIVQNALSKVSMIVQDLFEGVRSVISSNGSMLKSDIKSMLTYVVNLVKNVFGMITKAMNKLIDKITPIWNGIKHIFSGLIEIIKEVYITFKPIFDYLGARILALFSIISGVINGILEMITPLIEAIKSAVNIAVECIKAVCALLRGDFSESWEHVKAIGTNVVDVFKNLGMAIYNFFKGAIEGFMSFFSNIKDTLVNLLSSFWESITETFEKFKTFISEVITFISSLLISSWNRMIEGAKGFASKMISAFITCADKIKSVFSSMLNGIKSTLSKVWDTITGLFGNIKNFFNDMIGDAFNWGKNLISNIADGIKKTWNKVVDGVKEVGQSIADFLGFGSPTKKGPGHYADEWIPNLMNMMAEGMYKDLPKIQNATSAIASSLNIGESNQAVVGEGTSPFGDLLNGLLQSTTQTQMMPNSDGEIVLQIDGQTFARLIAPKLTKEYKRNGIILREV